MNVFVFECRVLMSLGRRRALAELDLVQVHVGWI